MRDQKYPIGTEVRDGDGVVCRVTRHGRDSANVYTEVEYADGRREKWHRSQLHLDEQEGA